VGAAQARAKPPKKSAAPETEQEPNDETTIRIFVRKEREKKDQDGYDCNLQWCAICLFGAKQLKVLKIAPIHESNSCTECIACWSPNFIYYLLPERTYDVIRFLRSPAAAQHPTATLALPAAEPWTMGRLERDAWTWTELMTQYNGILCLSKHAAPPPNQTCECECVQAESARADS